MPFFRAPVLAALTLSCAAFTTSACAHTTSGPTAASAKAATTATARPAAARKSPALKLIWGPNTMPNGTSAFPVYKRLGVDVLQIQLQWDEVATARPVDATNPDDPAYAWPRDLDSAVMQAQADDIDIALMIKGAPGWSNGNRPPSRVANDDQDYANFAIAAAKRYPHVRYWMIWGEPTRPGNFQPFPEHSPIGPRRYARMLDAAYGALKSVSSSEIVIGGMTWTVGLDTPPAFLHWLRLPNGQPPRMDLYGHNPFSRRFPDLAQGVYYNGIRDINDIDTLHADLRRNYGRKAPGIWLSEFTVASDHTNRAFDFSVSRSEQAHWVTAAYRLANSVPYIVGLGWFNLYDESPKLSRHPLTNGLMTSAGNPKAAFKAYQAVR